jgi:hypothetical protein
MDGGDKLLCCGGYVATLADVCSAVPDIEVAVVSNVVAARLRLPTRRCIAGAILVSGRAMTWTSDYPITAQKTAINPRAAISFKCAASATATASSSASSLCRP